jgi:adenylate kinase family enzyme
LERILKRFSTSNRDDDNRDAFLRRNEIFDNTTLPLLNHFDELKLTKRIEASKDQDDVILLISFNN